ncbi:MAG TPA: host attachment protein [Polyangiaceae bacterium]
MNAVWILVCDASKARFFETSAADPGWRLVSTLLREESRSKAPDHHHERAPQASPVDVEKERFAHALGRILDKTMRVGRFRCWVLVAPPRFAGLVRKELTVALKNRLLSTVHKDLGHLDTLELRRELHHTTRIPVDQKDVVRETHKRAH